jgi:ABC-2 type transport system ATP-binding protein
MEKAKKLVMNTDQSTVAPLKIVNLVKSYGSNQAVKGVSFDIRPGEIFGLLGPNGAGKTSIISCIVSLEKPTSGQIHVFGIPVSEDRYKRYIGFVPQEVINHGYFSLREILEFQSGYHGLRSNTQRIDELIKRLALEEHQHKKVRQLSGGLKRRLMIAKALVHKPKIVLLDEPTAGVDVELRSVLWDFVRELRDSGCSVLLTTHYLEEAERLCDRVAILDRGQIKVIDDTGDVLKKMTFRQVIIRFDGEAPDINSDLILQKRKSEIEFRLPAGMGLSVVIEKLQGNLQKIQDIKVVEGSLEDAFKLILRQDNNQSRLAGVTP